MSKKVPKEKENGKEDGKVKFVAKVGRMSSDRSVIVLPKEVYEDSIRLRGKYVKVTLEEVVL